MTPASILVISSRASIRRLSLAALSRPILRISPWRSVTAPPVPSETSSSTSFTTVNGERSSCETIEMNSSRLRSSIRTALRSRSSTRRQGSASQCSSTARTSSGIFFPSSRRSSVSVVFSVSASMLNWCLSRSSCRCPKITSAPWLANSTRPSLRTTITPSGVFSRISFRWASRSFMRFSILALSIEYFIE